MSNGQDMLNCNKEEHSRNDDLEGNKRLKECLKEGLLQESVMRERML